MPIISLKKGDYIRDPLHHEWRYIMVTRDVEINTTEQLFAKFYGVWVDEYLIAKHHEISFTVFIPKDGGYLIPVEMKHVLHFLTTIFEEISTKVWNLKYADEFISLEEDDLE